LWGSIRNLTGLLWYNGNEGVGVLTKTCMIELYLPETCQGLFYEESSLFVNFAVKTCEVE